MALTLATFNVKDFFPQPRGDFAAKVEWTARMVERADADVIGLQEVGPEETIAALEQSLRGRAYVARVIGTPDGRGIRCALLSRLPLVSARVHVAEALPFPAFSEGDPPPFGARIPLRRGVIVARVEAPGLGPVDILVAHFKSRRSVPLRNVAGDIVPPLTAYARAEADVRSMVWRAAEALSVRALADEALASREGAMVAVLGDLIDVPGSATLEIVTGDADAPGALRSAASIVPAERRFTAIFGGARTQLDHILVSDALHARLASAEILNADLREHPHVPTAAERAEQPDLPDPPPTIDSDHAPLVARFA